MAVKLSQKILAFCDAYAETAKAYDSAIAAGYAHATAKTKTGKWLADPGVQEQIQKRRDARAVVAGVTKEDVLRELWDIGSFDLGKLYNADGSTKKIHEIDEATRRALLQHNVVTDEEGNIKVETINAGKIKALELIAKHLGMLDKNTQTTRPKIAFNFNFTQPVERQDVPKEFAAGVDTSNNDSGNPAIPRVFKLRDESGG